MASMKMVMIVCIGGVVIASLGARFENRDVM